MRPFGVMRPSALATLVLVLALLACRGSTREAEGPGATSAPPGSAVGGTPSGPLDSDAGTVDEPEPIRFDVQLGPGDFHLGDPRAGLDDLSSYTARLVVSLDGTEAGQPRTETSTSTVWHTTSPSVTQLTISEVGDVATADRSFLAVLGEVAYAMEEGGACRAGTIDPESDPALSPIRRREPAALLRSVFGAEAAGSETVNGFQADHYLFDQRALFEAGISDAQGELWIAADSGVLLKYRLTATAAPDFFGEGIEGVVTWEYDLTDINTTVQPAFPEGCQLDVPLMGDATAVRHLPTWLSFTTSATFSEAAAFYQAQLPGGGWTLTLGPMASEASSFTEFTRGDETIGVFATAEGGITRVDIVRYERQD